MSKTPSHLSSVSASLEAQLEAVFEREGAPISVAPAMEARTRGRRPAAVDAEADRRSVQVVQSEGRRKAPRRVEVRFGPHEASPFVVRMDGVVGKPEEDVRHAYHRAMHRWESPYLEGVGLERVLSNASDLWIEALEEAFFHEQFTPGDPGVAAQESAPGIWSRLRKPFIRWTDRRAEGFEPPVLSRVVNGAEPEAVFGAGDGITVLASDAEEQGFAEEPVSYEPAAGPGVSYEISAMPDSGAAADMAAPAGSRLFGRLGDWGRGLRTRAADLHEEERLLVSDAEMVWQAPYLEPKIRVVRVFVGFLGMLCLVALPAGAVSWSRSVSRSVGSARASVSSLAEAGSGASAQAVSAGFGRVQNIAQDIDRSHGLAIALAQALPTTKETAGTVRALLETAEEASAAGTLLARAVDRVAADDVSKPDERLVRLLQYLDEAQPHLDRLFAAAARLEPDALPVEVRDRVATLRHDLLAYQPFVGGMRALAELGLPLVGHDQVRTYLVLFQNQAERRPSGGFMGSYAEVVVDRGEIRKLEVPGGGPYGLRSQLRERWRPPEPLQLVGARWEFQDANWFPDFADTADTVRTFWSRSGQPTLDGIVAVNASLLPKLLELTGPIEMPAYGRTVDAGNVLFETQKAVEIDYDRATNTPKAFVGDLNREVLARLQKLPRDRWLALATVVVKALETKEIQVRLFRSEEQEVLRSFGWTGEWSPPDAFDEAALVGANIAGQKTDAVIDEALTQDVRIDQQGRIETGLLLRRTHAGQEGELFRGANNVEYLRFYAPKGASITAADGFEAPERALFEVPGEQEPVFPGLSTSTASVSFGTASIDVGEEQGRAVFGGWVQLRPGTSRETTVAYRLPRSTADMARTLTQETDAVSAEGITDAYVLRLHSQSGAPRAQRIRIAYPASWKLRQASSGLDAPRPGILEMDISALEQDRTIYALFERE